MIDAPAARAAIGAERVRQAMRDENTGSPADRIAVIASRADDALNLAAAKRPTLREEVGT